MPNAMPMCSVIPSLWIGHAEVASIPEINARYLDAAIIHEAAIGRINDEQLVKLRTLGMTAEEGRRNHHRQLPELAHPGYEDRR